MGGSRSLQRALVVSALVLVVVGPVLASLRLNESGASGASAGLVTIGWTISAAAACLLVGVLIRSGGTRRERSLTQRFPDALVVGAVRTNEALTSFTRLLMNAPPTGGRLPLTFTVVVQRDGISLWGGSARSPRTLLQIPASAITSCEFSTINDTGLTRPTVEIKLVGLGAKMLPISPIGAGTTGMSPMSANRVADLAALATAKMAVLAEDG